jgi:hypothetical protein
MRARRSVGGFNAILLKPPEFVLVTKTSVRPAESSGSVLSTPAIRGGRLQSTAESPELAVFRLSGAQQSKVVPIPVIVSDTVSARGSATSRDAAAQCWHVVDFLLPAVACFACDSRSSSVAAAITKSGIWTECFFAHAIFWALLKQQQLFQHSCAERQPHGRSWQGKG